MRMPGFAGMARQCHGQGEGMLGQQVSLASTRALVHQGGARPSCDVRQKFVLQCRASSTFG